jgi:hypothetical protein
MVCRLPRRPRSHGAVDWHYTYAFHAYACPPADVASRTERQQRTNESEPNRRRCSAGKTQGTWSLFPCAEDACTDRSPISETGSAKIHRRSPFACMWWIQDSCPFLAVICCGCERAEVSTPICTLESGLAADQGEERVGLGAAGQKIYSRLLAEDATVFLDVGKIRGVC